MDGPGCDTAALPACGPGDECPLGPGLGAVPADFAAGAPLVGLGLGTPWCAAGATDATGPGDAGAADGLMLARAITAGAVGAIVGPAGAGVAGLTDGRAVGAGGCRIGCAVGTALGAGEGAAVGGIFTVTAGAAAVGTFTGTAATSAPG
ncbi:MAG: hypothetical protein ACLQPV_00965, partial [Vulcanimicrobiaceae bacterium]